MTNLPSLITLKELQNYESTELIKRFETFIRNAAIEKQLLLSGSMVSKERIERLNQLAIELKVELLRRLEGKPRRIEINGQGIVECHNCQYQGEGNIGEKYTCDNCGEEYVII